ncbi:hypothetical protein RJ639_046977 [Escallonia herrerae]|uniref:Transposase-associated domain-containing protein n=1 Tax=Escallonia herrerae TaxID=1293975 RepID=A0AA88W5L8_9ASTE|nr:hypothetical protein RJ639_046977 [Escallonia herrerae]
MGVERSIGAALVFVLVLVLVLKRPNKGCLLEMVSLRGMELLPSTTDALEEETRVRFSIARLKINMDKTWINIQNILDPLYEKGANDFVEFASKDRPNATEILCPCTKCRNMKFVKKVDVAEHILVDGFLSSYTHWIFHGQSSLTSNYIPEPVVGDRTQEMIRDVFGVPLFNQLDERYSGEGNENSDDLDDATKKFFNLVKEAEKEFEHHSSIRRSNRRLRPHDVNKVHNKTFHMWFRNHVQKLYEEGDEALSEEIISLAMGPLKKAKRYTGYVINGFKYHTKACESNRTTQHSGVMVNANTDSYASARDMNPIAGDVNYYGVLIDIIVLHYSKKYRFVLFKCDWVDNGTGLVDRDGLGFMLVNFNHLAHSHSISDEPFYICISS